MSYYTYENWHARGDRARVHVGECKFCNHGKGLSGGTDPARGKWHGPFDSIVSAKATVRGVTPILHRCAA
jgi:hypothetical protein